MTLDLSSLQLTLTMTPLCDIKPGKYLSNLRYGIRKRLKYRHHQVQLCEPMSFPGGYLQEQQWLKDNCITKVYLTIDNSSGKLTTWHTLHLAGSSLGWSKPFAASSVGLRLLQEAWLISFFHTSSFYLSQKDLVNLVNFRNFLKVFWVISWA